MSLLTFMPKLCPKSETDSGLAIYSAFRSFRPNGSSRSRRFPYHQLDLSPIPFYIFLSTKRYIAFFPGFLCVASPFLVSLLLSITIVRSASSLSKSNTPFSCSLTHSVVSMLRARDYLFAFTEEDFFVDSTVLSSDAR